MPVRNPDVQFRVPASHALTNHIGGGQADEQHADGDDSRDNPDTKAAQAVFAGEEFVAMAVIAVVTTAVTATVRNLSWAAASQLRLLLYVNALQGRHG